MSWEECKIILAFDANAKLLDLTEKLKTASDKYRINMVTWPRYLTFAVNVILNLSNVDEKPWSETDTAGILRL